MKLTELDYHLPPELIAQRPLDRRDDSRLLVYDRGSGEVRHRRFRELPEELEPETLDAARAGDGVRGRGGDPAPVPARDRRALPLLLVRRCDGDPMSFEVTARD